MRKFIVGLLMLTCSFSTAVRASNNSLPFQTLRYQQNVPILRDAGRWSDEERRRQDEERRRQEEERRRQEEQRRRQDEERRRQEEQRCRQDEERRRQEEQRRQDEERRRQDEDRRRQDEQRRQDEERRRQDEERRRQDEQRHRPEVPPPPHNGPRPGIEIRFGDPQARFKAKQVLRETANYLIRAQQAARRGGYSFGLGRAYAHQEEARNLYMDGQYRQAINHSMRAREIAQDVIEANRPGRRHRPGPPPEYDDSLDNELSVNIRDDKAILSLRIKLD